MATNDDFLDDAALKAGDTRVARDYRPLSYGLVIGLGGTGIQTISRVRHAVQGNRPDAAAVESVRFLGIDAVKWKDQNPPIASELMLPPREFFNLTGTGFDPDQVLRARGRSEVCPGGT